MGQIIPIRLQEVVSVREDAQNQIRMLDPARQHQLWSAVDGLVRAGFSTVKKFSEMHLEFVCRTGTLIYGAAKINQILMIFRLWKTRCPL